MKRLKNRKIGYAPGSVIYTGEKNKNELVIKVLDYTKSSFKEVALADLKSLDKYENSEAVTWLNLNGLNHTAAIKEIANYYEIHHLITEDIPNINQRTKIDIYPNCIFIVFKMLYYSKDKNLHSEHISFVLGKDYLLSFQEAEGDVFESIRERIRTGKGFVRERKSDYLLYLLLDAIVDSYFLIVDEIGDKIDFFENKILNKNNENDLTFEIQNLKREVLKLRKVIFPLKDLINKIQKTENSYISKDTDFYFLDLEDHLLQIIDSIEIYREMIVGLMEMQLTVVSNKMNGVMKVLTIISTIFIPMTFIAGVYGMNFENIPELSFKYGYYIFWIVIIVILILLILFFKKKKWL